MRAAGWLIWAIVIGFGLGIGLVATAAFLAGCWLTRRVLDWMMGK